MDPRPMPTSPSSAHKSEERKQPGVERTYRTDQIAVYWEPALCIHTARCLRALPEVFDVNRRPWVLIHAAPADAVAAAVMRCPTGALRFERFDGAAQEILPDPPVIEAQPDGPLYVRGRVRIVSRHYLQVQRIHQSRSRLYVPIHHRNRPLQVLVRRCPY